MTMPTNLRSRRLRISCVLIGWLFFVSIADAQQAPRKSLPLGTTQGIGTSKLAGKPTEVLGGRLTVRLPDGARVEARPFDIMSAPESEEHETRVMFDAGQERLVLLAHECFALAGDDLFEDVSKWVAQWKGKYEIERVAVANGRIKAVAVIPRNDPDHTRSDDATFVEGVFVQSTDRTIQSLDVYVNAVAEKDLKGCKAVASQILLSVAPGKRTLNLAAGERRLYVYSKDREISVTVPKNTVATKQVGPDFLVHRLIVLGPLAADSDSILIYAGFAPNYEPGAKKGDGMLLGKRVEWHGFPKGDGVQTLCDLSIPGNDDLKLHIIIHASTDIRLQVLKQSVESLKVVDSKNLQPR